MPPGKRPGLPAPIDRPLSKAYLREFAGWSTAFPPGRSDPTTLREMENVWITRESAVAVRPALRSIFDDDVFFDSAFGGSAVGSFEPFFTSTGEKAFLFASREILEGAERVAFRCANYNPATQKYELHTLTNPIFGFDIPQGAATLAFTAATTYVKYVQIDNKIFALSDAGESMRMFNVGATKSAKKLTAITYPRYITFDRLTVLLPDDVWVAGAQETRATWESLSSNTLVHSTAASNTYNFGYFYTFNNEIGESAASMISVVRTQRGWSSWTKDLVDDSKSADQLVCHIPIAVYNAALAQGAISWNLYMLTWTDQSSVPVEGVLLKTTSMVDTTMEKSSWASHTPLLQGLDDSAPLPNETNRYNYSAPSTAAQGLVAADRLVLVNDKLNAAVIRWSSNQQGSYTDFSASKGGGYKTLTSGNLYVPACVKLWQNPQSADTITLPCAGVDGYSTSYYMAPNTTVTGQTATTTIMGFEETTATPGTVSPYGVEVLNNAMYHPLDSELMKSTASNYNINHKTMTDAIQNKWRELRNKKDIISSQMDNRLYFIVNNPDGKNLPTNAKGNEIWVYDTAGGEEGTWSRWLIPAVSLRKLEIAGKLYMSVVKPDGIYILDETAVYDTVNVEGVTTEIGISWKFETNTQGANRQHDAWAFLQQLNVGFGNFYGTVKYGIRGWDVNGKAVEISKTFRQLDDTTRALRIEPSDIEDYLLIRKTLREWRLFMETLPIEGVVWAGGGVRDLPSFGQLSLVQYRYTPVSVNVGYEYGSVETFEYGRASANWTERTTDNGVPQPYIDTRRP